jgi:hypothetical protein
VTPFESVGFPFRSDSDYDDAVPAVLDRMMAEAERVPCPAGSEGWSYRDPSGAGLLAFFSKDADAGTRSLACLKPVFFGGSRQPVSTGALVEAEDCAFCDVARVDVLRKSGDVAYGAVVRISDPYFRRFSWKAGTLGLMQATLFGLEMDPWKREGTDSGRIRNLGEVGFLPTGADHDPPLPEAVVAGRVLQAERRRNVLGGAEFVWARVDAAETEYDLVLPTSLCPDAPAAGTVLQVAGRLYARRFRQ